MNQYIKNLKSFLSEQSPNFGYADANSILDMLFYYYIDANQIDNAVIRCQFRDLDITLSDLSWENNEKVFSLAVDLCISHAKKAFTEGVLIGMQLFTELQ